MNRRWLFRLVVELGAACLFGSTVGADEFVLKSGARLRGEWLNPDELPLTRYAVRTDEGVQVTVSVRQVAAHAREPVTVAEYERLAPQFADTVDEQWKLAEWCRERGLKEQRGGHLRRVVELNPQNAAAWQALGYSEIGGQWTTKKDFFEERGYVFFRGKWRLTQEIAVIEERERVAQKEREWFAQFKLWRSQFGTEREAEALRGLAAVRDPAAVKALADQLRKDKRRHIRLLCIDSAAQIHSPAAIELLVSVALNDTDLEVFHRCAEQLIAVRPPGFLKVLTPVLHDSQNVRVNRAAHLIGRLGERQAIPALAAALVTLHATPQPRDGRTTATFVPTEQPAPNGLLSGANSQSGAGLSTGRAPERPPTPIANQEVLQALVTLSGGQSFGFDTRAWLNWWSTAGASASPAHLK